MSVNGKVIPHTPLAVDFWQVRKCPGARLFFLSHMHSDHTVGLTSTWSHRPIYCSPTTASILRLRLQVKEQWIHPLELGEPYLLPLDDIGKEKLTVTLMDANHCPGAVMFLFEGYFGCILYTGDFRYIPSMLREPCLRTNITIDILYLDNTNCDPNRTLPSRQQATQQIKEIIRRHPNHSIVIGLYALGKESLLEELAMEFKTWIEVSIERMENLRVLELADVFTTDAGAGQIRVVGQSEICAANLSQWNKEEPTLAILPTSRPLVSSHPNLFVVPYSDHSSYQELEDFVSALKPTTIVPIVGNHVPGSLSTLLPSRKRHEILVPESVQHYMLRQPERESSSSALTSLCRKHLRPIGPKGVIFESPLKGAGSLGKEVRHVECLKQNESEEEMDTVSSDESDCIFIDLSKDFVPKQHRRRPRDEWKLNIVKRVSEDMAITESVSLSQLTQSNFAPVDVMPNAKASLKPIRTTTKSFKTSTTINEETAINGTNQQSRYGNVQDINSLADGDGLSQQDENDQVDDSNFSQHNGHSHNDRGEKSLDSVSCASSNSLTTLQQQYVEDNENSILNDLPFTEWDFKTCGLLQKSFVKQFDLIPVCDKNLNMSN